MMTAQAGKSPSLTEKEHNRRVENLKALCKSGDTTDELKKVSECQY